MCRLYIMYQYNDYKGQLSYCSYVARYKYILYIAKVFMLINKWWIHQFVVPSFTTCIPLGRVEITSYLVTKLHHIVATCKVTT